jgi:hypothetical protein
VAGFDWYITPMIGLGIILISYVYYLIFNFVIPKLKRQERMVIREPLIVRQFGKDDGEWVQALEVIDIVWVARGSKEN